MSLGAGAGVLCQNKKEYPNWALPSFDSSQQGKPWEFSSTFLKMLSWVLETSST